MSELLNAMRQAKSQKGFSLIELLIVVAITGVIAAIAIPNLLASRRAANEAAAISALRAIGNAQQIYIQHVGNNTNYAASLMALGPTGTDLIDNVLGSSTTSRKSGYDFTMTGGALQFMAHADPVTPGISGQRHFFTDMTGVIRSNATTSAGTADTPIQ